MLLELKIKCYLKIHISWFYFLYSHKYFRAIILNIMSSTLKLLKLNKSVSIQYLGEFQLYLVTWDWQPNRPICRYNSFVSLLVKFVSFIQKLCESDLLFKILLYFIVFLIMFLKIFKDIYYWNRAIKREYIIKNYSICKKEIAQFVEGTVYFLLNNQNDCGILPLQ